MQLNSPYMDPIGTVDDSKIQQKIAKFGDVFETPNLNNGINYPPWN